MSTVQKVKGYEIARSDAEAELAYIDAETARMTAELAQLAFRRLTVIKILDAVKEGLGEVVPKNASMEGNTQSSEELDGLSLVARNAYRGLGPAEAALKHLRLLEHGETHARLVEALLKGNVRSGSKHPADSFRTALQRRPNVFVWRKEQGRPGRWELKEWQRADESSTEETSQSAASPRALSLVGQK
jgi:hypothetical protein